MALPKILKDYNLFLDGVSYAGKAESITLPKLELKTEEYQAAGMIAPIEIDLGMSVMKMDVTLSEYSDAVLSLWGTADVGGINARFVGAAVAADGSGTDAIEISVRGRWKSLDFGEAKAKEKSKLKVEMPLTYYRYNVNGTTMIEIDAINGSQSVNGTVLTDVLMKALGLAA